MNWQEEVANFKQGLAVESSVISTQAVRVGFFGAVGGGKSVTAGKCAIGLTPSGSIGWVDGEGKRSGWAISIVAEMAAKKYGGTKQSWVDRFKVIHIDPPYNPLRVVAAIELLEEQGCKTGILDVMTQCWDSDGGYLDMKDEVLGQMAGDDENKRRKAMSAAAARVKPWTHGKLVNKVNCSKINLILLFQAKQKYNAKTFRPDDFIAPIQESGLTRTALAVGRVESNNDGVGGFCSFQLPQEQGTKYTHPSILACLPKNNQQFEFEHAEALLKLCGGTPASGLSKHAEAAPVSEDKKYLDELKKRLFKITKPKHGGDVAALQQFLWDENHLALERELASLSAEELENLLVKLEPIFKA